MRVIAGEFKGMPLRGPEGRQVRPTTDRVKEAMFSLLGLNIGNYPAVDLFTGSGALGIESLSRGCPVCIFVDNHKSSLNTVKLNLHQCRVPETSYELWKMDWKQALTRISRLHADVGWVFVDPPYALDLWTRVLQQLDMAGMRVHNGVVCEHPKDILLPEDVAHFHLLKRRTYGDIAVSIYAQHRNCQKKDDAL